MIKIKDIKWQKVESSQIAAFNYNDKERALFVKFNRGQVWQYTPFNLKEYHELMDADSIGKHFHANIKNNKKAKELKYES